MLLASVFKGIGSQGRRLQRSKLRSQLNKIHIRYCHICVTIKGTTLFGGLLADIFIYSYKIVEAFRTLRKVSLICHYTAFECVSYYWVRTVSLAGTLNCLSCISLNWCAFVLYLLSFHRKDFGPSGTRLNRSSFFRLVCWGMRTWMCIHQYSFHCLSSLKTEFELIRPIFIFDLFFLFGRLVSVWGFPVSWN